MTDAPQRSRAWLSIGSNVDRERNIRGAVRALRARFGSLVISQVYESDAVGFSGDPFYNLVVGIETEQPVKLLIPTLREIENAHGRSRSGGKFSSRTLDIDLLTYGEQSIEAEGIQLPRDEITRYAFVLKPLSEVAADERHPGSGRSYRQLWEAFDQSAQPLRPVVLESLAPADRP